MPSETAVDLDHFVERDGMRFAGTHLIVRLVYPGEEDTDIGRVSVLTPIGAALIGLSEGQSIRWRSALGDWRDLTVLRIRQVLRSDCETASPSDADREERRL